MARDYLVMDDFLADPDGILEGARSERFLNHAEGTKKFGNMGRYRGERTRIFPATAEPIRQQLEETFGIKLVALFLHRHPPMPGVEGRRHIDRHSTDRPLRTAGVIYLEGGPGCGTEIGRDIVEFQKNRLVIYRSDIFHRPVAFLQNRLVIIFFSEDLPAVLR